MVLAATFPAPRMNVTAKRLFWLVLLATILFAQYFPLSETYAEFIHNPSMCTTDARQQIVPYMQPNYEKDYASVYYRQSFIPLGIDGLYTLAAQLTDINRFAKWVGLALLAVTLIFGGMAAFHLAGYGAALAAMLYMLSLSDVLMTTLHAIPRSYAMPLMAMGLWAASARHYKSMGLVAVLSVFFYPAITLICGTWLGIILLFKAVKESAVNRFQVSKENLLTAMILLLAVGLLACVSSWHSDRYHALITPAMVADFPESGLEGRYRSVQDNMLEQSPAKSFLLRSYFALAGGGEPLIRAFDLRSYLSPASMARSYVIIALWLTIAFGIACLLRAGNSYPAFLAVTVLLALNIDYATAYITVPKLFLPDRYYAYPFSVLLPVFLACAMEGIARIPAFSGRWKTYGMRLCCFVLPLILLGGTNMVRDKEDSIIAGSSSNVEDITLAEPFRLALERLPRDAVIAGWPGEGGQLDNIAFVTHNPVWARYKTHQAFHSGYVLEMRRRTLLLIDALFSADPMPIRQLRAEGVTYLIVKRNLYQGSNPPEYFEPFGSYIKAHWQDWKKVPPYLLSMPASHIVYQDKDWAILSL
jgi:hypothetical protein